MSIKIVTVAIEFEILRETHSKISSQSHWITYQFCYGHFFYP